jgi:Short C-terminal domain
VRKRLAVASVVLLIVSVVGFGASLILNAFVLDDFDAYGEVPIPGTQTLHLPAGDVKVSFHTEITGSFEGGGLPTPPGLEVTITPPSGVAQPEFTHGIGDTTADNQDVHVQVGVAHIPVAGDYTVKTNGKASAFLSPRLSFGHGSNYGFLPWLFGGLAGLGLLGLLASPFVGPRNQPTAPPKPKTPLQQLTTLASLHDSGALTDEEYEAEKRRILDDL